MGGEFPNRKESPLNITLVQAVARGEKVTPRALILSSDCAQMDFILQKAVELGVTRLAPVFTERCGVKVRHAA